jgi:hypothetical protein
MLRSCELDDQPSLGLEGGAGERGEYCGFTERYTAWTLQALIGRARGQRLVALQLCPCPPEVCLAVLGSARALAMYPNNLFPLEAQACSNGFLCFASKTPQISQYFTENVCV